VRYGMREQLVTPYRVTHSQRYEVMLRGNVTSVYPPLNVLSLAPLAFPCYVECSVGLQTLLNTQLLS
jgi:hypothetical protein